MNYNGSFRLASSRLHSAISALPHGLMAVALAATASLATAADLTWDSDTGTTAAQGGSGTWNTSNTNWWNGTANTAWVNTTTTNANTGFTATLGGSDGAYTLTTGAPIIASNLNVTASGYTLVNSGSNFLTLTFTTTTGSGTFTSAASQIFVAAGKTFNIGSGADSTIVKANGGGALSTSSQIHIDTGSVLNINAGASLLRDNNSGNNNGGIRFTGSGTVNLYGTVSNTANNDGIRIGEYDANSVTFNVKSGGLLTTASSGTNVSNAALTVAGGSGTATSGTVTLNIETGGTVSVTNTASTQGFSIARQAGSVGIANVSGTLITPKIVVGNGAAGAVGTLNLDGGTLRANRTEASFIEAQNSGTFNVNVKAGGVTIDTNGFNVGISKALLDGTGGGGLTKSSTGTLTLSGANTYTGNTTVNAGSLLLNSTNTSNVVVNSGGTIGGVGGSTSGSLVTNTGANILTNLTGTALAVNGSVNFAGITTVSFNGTPTTGLTYDVLSYTNGLSNLPNLVPTSRATIADTGTKITATAGAIGTRTWNTTGGTWDIGQSSNWTEGDLKFFNSDSVVFADPASSSVVTLATNMGSLQPASVSVNNTNAYTFTGSGSIAGTGTLAKSGTGSLTINTANSYSGGTTLNAGTLNVNNAGALGTGTLTINGGTLNNSSGSPLTTTSAVAQTWNGNFATGNGSLNFNGGAATVAASSVAVTMGGGTVTVGSLTNNNSALSLTGSGTLAVTTTNPTYVGYTSGIASMAIDGVNFSTGGDLRVGGSDVNGAAPNGNGTLTIANSTVTVNGTFLLARGNNNLNTVNGTATLNSGTLNSVSDTVLGFAGVGNLGKLTINGGTMNVGTAVTKWMIIHQYDTTSGQLDINGGTLNLLNNSALKMHAGNGNANAVVNQNGGDVTFYSDSGSTIGGTGDLNLQQVAGTNTSTYNLNGGTLTAPAVASTATNGARTFNFNGGTLKAAKDNATFFNLGAGSARANVRNGGANIHTNGFNVTIAQALVHSDVGGDAATDGGLIKSGAGTLTLSGANTYTGNTTISAGTLALASTGSIANSAAIIANGTFDVSLATGFAIGVGQTLKGSGTIIGATTVNGILAPGNSPGVISFSGDLTLGSGSTSVFEVDGLSRGSGYDGVDVGGALTYGGTLSLVFDAPITAGTYDLVGGAFTSPSGTFGTITTGGAFSEIFSDTPAITGTGWTAGSAGWTYVFNNLSGDLTISAVPEPSSFAALTGLVGLGLAASRRRRRA